MKSDLPIAEENPVELIPEHCPDLMALLDVNGLFLYGNRAHLHRLGRAAESLIGTTIFELIHPDDAPAFEKAIVGRASKRTAFRLNGRWLKEDAAPARFDSIGKWIPADRGRSYYLLLCSREVMPERTKLISEIDAAELRADAAKLLAQAEGEKNDVARAIHDDLGQKLTAVSLELALWKAELDQGQSKSLNAIREKMAVLGDLVNSTISFTRKITVTLRPRVLEEFGLAAALEWHLEKVQRQTGMACTFAADGQKPEMDAFVAAQIFRIAEEIMASRVQAGCRSLHLRLLFQEQVVALVFEDSGKDRLLSAETCARVRLLGGEIEVNREEQMIAVALSLKTSASLLDQPVL
ncbi:MAG TPA: histidine kinase [Candidatus Limnocylindria bacterium]|nr:histidine kinase [Candidatus Limnocylindria bacterium]